MQKLMNVNFFNLYKSIIVLRRLNGMHLPQEKRFESTIKLKQLSQELYTNEPKIGFLASKQYSTSELNGFISVPFRFEIKGLIEYYNENKGKVQDRMKKIHRLYNTGLTIVSQIFENYQIKVKEYPMNDLKKWKEFEIAVKHLKKLLEKDDFIREKLRGITIEFDKDYKISNDCSLIVLPIWFNDKKFKEFLLVQPVI